MKNIVLFLILGSFLNMGEIAWAGPQKKVIAGPESTVYGIAYENGIPTRALIAANSLKPPYVLHKGQVLIIPSPNEHVAGPGETLQSIAEEYGVNVDVLAQENDAQSVKQGEQLSIPSRDTESLATALKPPSQEISTSSLAPLASVKSIPPTDKIRRVPHTTEPSPALPSELAEEIAREKGVIAGSTVSSEEDAASKSVLMGNLAQGNAGAPIGSALLQEEEPVKKPKKERKNKEKIKKEEQTKEKQPVSEKKEAQEEAKQPEFIWPVKGTVLTKFKPGKSDGIKIKVPEDTSVKAAAAGDVLYAGNELKEFGNLLLLKHKGGWVTAYAHNSSLLVKKGDVVKQGQVIAKSGKTGNVKEPQLHFEVRKGKQPVDPLTKLES